MELLENDLRCCGWTMVGTHRGSSDSKCVGWGLHAVVVVIRSVLDGGCMLLGNGWKLARIL